MPHLRTGALALFLFFVIPGTLAAQPSWQRIEDFRSDLTAEAQADATAIRARALATEAYLWGLPAFLNFRQATEFKAARRHLAPDAEPFGGWMLLRDLATPDVDNALPNVDTLYGAAYVHLGKQGPVVLDLPDIEDRYYSVALVDAYFNNFEVLGTRTLGGRAGRFLIVPPGWSGTAPPHIARVIESPTPVMAIYQRIYVRGPADVPAVRKLQDAIALYPSGGAPGDPFPRIDTPEFDVSTPVRDTRDPLDYFRFVNRYTGVNPPSVEYRALTASFADAGIGPGAALPTDNMRREAIRAGAADAQKVIDGAISAGPFRNGWRLPDPKGAKPGPYILSQAVLQISQIGSLPADEAVYYVGRRDAAGELLDGRSHYTLTFPAGQLPPVDDRGFWSLTMYRASNNLLVANDLDRYVIRPTTPGLALNGDGSLTLHLSHERPEGVPEGNWLPAPAEGFLVALRAYLPKEAARNETWFPPAIGKVE